MTRIAGGSGTSSPPDPSGGAVDQTLWTRVDGVQGSPLDLLTARIGRRHYAPHIHDEYAIGVTVAGLETMRYRGEKIYSGAGSVVVVEPGEAHTGGPALPEGFAYRCFYPDAELLSAATSGGPSALPHFREAIIDDQGLGEALRLAHRALRLGEDPLEGESRLLSVLGTLVARHAVQTPKIVPGGRRGDAGRIARAVTARLSDELLTPPTLAEVADGLELSRYQLLRAFRDTVGMPPYAWLAQYRVMRARTLLEAGHRPAEVAALVGFADQAHLTRWFRRVVGVTPGVYRNSVQDSMVRRIAS
ncbi:helix-turn-helix transcriptional regulator [Actinomadura livida]|uniref:AraC-like DNA-binding protein n=1 Tax=Actinomadura livida TaxID=79909 RepID=A0A7W7N1H6_9ACTN|nr:MULTISPECIES: AraC family transcriptional regulator [Actinomadura]MBB4779003.1 AraC-like DNA-binding protein [Actinomadura catellatispora]GGU01014.1 AraC family transcriptional regulator [Actinomadura livida]